MSELDWLDEPPTEVGEAQRLQLLADERRRQEAEHPRMEADTIARVTALATLNLATPTVPDAPAKQQQMFTAAWRRLTEHQRVYLFALRDHSFVERQAVDSLLGTQYEIGRHRVRRMWGEHDDFQFCAKVLRNAAYNAVIDKQTLVLRAHEVAEAAMVPKPILYHGVPTGYYEMQSAAVLAANEQILKTAGHLKNAEATRVRVRIVNLAGPEDDKDVIDGTAVEVDIETPSFLE